MSASLDLKIKGTILLIKTSTSISSYKFKLFPLGTSTSISYNLGSQPIVTFFPLETDLNSTIKTFYLFPFQILPICKILGGIISEGVSFSDEESFSCQVYMPASFRISKAYFTFAISLSALFMFQLLSSINIYCLWYSIICLCYSFKLFLSLPSCFACSFKNFYSFFNFFFERA